MSNSYAPAHHQTTSDAPGSSSSNNFGQKQELKHLGDSVNNRNTTYAQDDSTQAQPQLNSVHKPRTTIDQPQGPLASTQGPFQQPTTDDVKKSDAPPFSSVSQQSAPGRAGSIGDAALGALGFGGSTVERPPEEQGLGEKIVNFLGA